MNIDADNMKDLIAKITTSIENAQCVEALNPGHFQRTIGTMFRLNNIPLMNFPTDIVNTRIQNLYKDVMSGAVPTERCKGSEAPAFEPAQYQIQEEKNKKK